MCHPSVSWLRFVNFGTSHSWYLFHCFHWALVPSDFCKPTYFLNRSKNTNIQTCILLQIYYTRSRIRSEAVCAAEPLKTPRGIMGLCEASQRPNKHYFSLHISTFRVICRKNFFGKLDPLPYECKLGKEYFSVQI